MKKSLFINLVTLRPSYTAKAVRMGMKFLNAGWSVELYPNLDAVAIFAPDNASDVDPVTGKLISELIDEFMTAGGRITVGAECLKVAGYGEGDLPEGVALSTFPGLEESMGADGVRIISF